jgi:hypothetical protein
VYVLGKTSSTTTKTATCVYTLLVLTVELSSSQNFAVYFVHKSPPSHEEDETETEAEEEEEEERRRRN